MTNRRAVAVTCFIAFALMGISSSVLGPTLKNLADSLSLPIESAGILRAVQSIGSFVMTLAGGRVLDRHSTRRILVPGLIIMGLGMAGLVATNSLPVALVASLLIGAGTGFLNLGANVAIAALYETHASSVLSALHTFFGLGLFGGPLLAEWALRQPDGWHLAYLIPAALCVVLAILFTTPPLTVHPPQRQDGSTKHLNVSILWVPLIPLIMLLFSYNGVGNALNDWIATHLRLVANANVDVASQVTSLYGLALTLGRIISIPTLRWFGNIRVLAVALTFATIGAALIVFAGPQVGLVAFGVLLTGAGFGPIYPTMIAIGGQLQPEIRGTITGILAGIASVGGIVVPFVQGKIGGGQNGGMIVTFVGTLVMVVSLLMIQVLVPKPAAAVAPSGD